MRAVLSAAGAVSLALAACAGPAGPQGPTGPAGPQGPAGMASSLTAGAGIDIAGNTISLMSCANGDVPRSTGSGWECVTFSGGTTYSPGNGISINGGTISLATSGCANGQVLQFNGAQWVCATVSGGGTTYTAAPNGGLALNGTAFSLQSCTNGQMLQSNGSTWSCVPAPSGGGTTYTTAPNGGLALNGTALSLASCAKDQVLQSTGSGGWACANLPTPTMNTGGDTLGHLLSNPGATCADIKTKVPSSGDGTYLIDPDGVDAGNPPFQVYCDMTRDNGGWTLIMRNWYQSGLAGNSGAVGSPSDANNNVRLSPYKLSDAVVRQIIGSDQNFDILVDQLGNNTMYAASNNEFVIVRNYTGTYTYGSNVAESSTATVFESYKASDNSLIWRGRLLCGASSTAGGFGINCDPVSSTPNPVGAPNPQGGLGCLQNLGTATNPGWHFLYQGHTNTDTYMYICNGAQHTSSFSNVHRWWVR